MNEIHRHIMKPFIVECGIIHNRLQALVYLLSLKWLPPVLYFLITNLNGIYRLLTIVLPTPG